MKTVGVIDKTGSLFISITPETADDAAALALFAMNANAVARKVSQVSVQVENGVSMSAWVCLHARRDCTPRNPIRRQLVIQRAKP